MHRQPLEIGELSTLSSWSASPLTRPLEQLGHRSGSFVTKVVKGGEYYYFQHSEPGGKKTQTYVGRRDASLDAVVRAYAEARESLAPDVESIERLCSLLRAGGAMVTDQGSARVLRAWLMLGCSTWEAFWWARMRSSCSGICLGSFGVGHHSALRTSTWRPISG